MCLSVVIRRDPPGRSSQKAIPVKIADGSQGLLCLDNLTPLKAPVPPKLAPVFAVEIIGEEMLHGDADGEGASPSELRV